MALFGGTFDPIHAGHIAVAQAAQRRFHLDAVYFVVSSRPPHKTKAALTPFAHRFAMAALACADHPGFLPSLAEAPVNGATPHVFYTVDTVRDFTASIRAITFILLSAPISFSASRRGKITRLCSTPAISSSRAAQVFGLDALRLVIPPEKLGRAIGQAASQTQDSNRIVLHRSAVHLMNTVASHVSSTEVRERLEQGKSIHGLVPARVEEYILGQALYR